MSRRRRIRGDDGQVAGIEVLPFGLLIFVIGSLLVANAWAVVDAKIAVSAASREAARVFVESPDEPTAQIEATLAARDAIAGHGRNPDKVSLAIEYRDGRSWGRCARITATTHYPVPALTLPWIGGLGHAFDVRSSASEIIDPFRAGLPAGTGCT